LIFSIFVILPACFYQNAILLAIIFLLFFLEEKQVNLKNNPKMAPFWQSLIRMYISIKSFIRLGLRSRKRKIMLVKYIYKKNNK